MGSHKLYIPGPALILTTCFTLDKARLFKPQLPQLSIEKKIIKPFSHFQMLPLKVWGIASGPSTHSPSFAASRMLCHCACLEENVGSVRNLVCFSTQWIIKSLPFFLIHNTLQLCLSSCYLCFFPTS